MKEKDNLGYINFPMGSYKTRLSEKFKTRIPFHPVNPMVIVSYIPGTIMDILVKTGQEVEKGDDLLILEAMKMKNRLKSHMKGKIIKICVDKGDKVSKGTLLIEME
jgi:biotin carboxyl carrier protein